MKNACFAILVLSALTFSSCNEAFWQGMAQGAAGMGGYGMGGYQVMPGGFVRNTSMDYLLDPRYAMQQVLNQEQQEYQAAKQYRPNLTLEQFRIEKGLAIQEMLQQVARQYYGDLPPVAVTIDQTGRNME